MKEKQYVSAGTCIVSTVFGVLSFFVSWLFLRDLMLTVTVGVGTACVSAIVLPVHLWLEDRRYLDIEDVIAEEILLKEQINFSYPANGRTGYLCLTHSAIYLFSRDRKPYFAYRLPRESMLSAELKSAVCVKLLMRNEEDGDDAVFTVLSPNGEEIYKTLCENGWAVGNVGE